MSARSCILACFLISLLGAFSTGTEAQSPVPFLATPQVTTPTPQPAAPEPAIPAPQVDAAAIAKKANGLVGVDIEAKIQGWRTSLDRIEQALRDPKTDYKALNAYRAALPNLRADGDQLWQKLQPALKSAEDDAANFPPAPAQGQPPELAQTANARAEANAYLGYLRSARSTLDAMQSRVNKLISLAQDVRRSRVTNNLFLPMTGAFSAETWRSAPQEAVKVATGLKRLTTEWWLSQDRDQVMMLAGLAFSFWLISSFLGVLAVRRMRRWKIAGDPPFWKRASTAAGVIIIKSTPGVVSLVFLYNAIDQYQAIPNEIGWIFYSGARSIMTIIVVNALIATVLSPSDHRWRLLPASNASAVKISGLILFLVLIFGIATFAVTVAYMTRSPNPFKVVLSLPPLVAIGLLVIAILKVPFGREQPENLPSISWLRALRLPIWLVAFAIMLTAIAGYISLSRFIAQQLIVTGAILAIIYLLLLWADWVARAMADESTGIGLWLFTTAGLDQSQRQRLAVPVSLLLKFAILLSAIPLILNQWQFAWTDIFEWYRQLFYGFHIGNTQISLGAVLASIVVFVLGYFAARLFQHWLDAQVLQPAGLSGGLRDSISTGVGYIGVFAAALMALSYAGFNLSNLALVAGAFSVGIGFGMQSIVSNFVSGLILLAERPIKVGDLVVVGGEEGFVRKISVRSTEIETFDRANVLIPNAYFISEKVKNWTLRNNNGRVAIAVGVAYGSDPRTVKTLLLQVAKNHPNVMQAPEPFIDFENFGADSLDFKLYAYTHDLKQSISTRTELRIAILETFKAAGIEIPFRQTDINVRDMDWLRDAVKQYMSHATATRLTGNGHGTPVSSTGQSE